MKSLKDCSDTEIHEIIDQALKLIRESANQYGEIRIVVSGGRVKFLTVEQPLGISEKT